MSKKFETSQIVSIKTNCSDNPFAYIRSREDIDILLTNMVSPVFVQALATKPVLQLLSLLISYMLHECNCDDWNFSSMAKLLNSADPRPDDIDSTLDYIFQNASDPDFRKEYAIFKDNFWSIHTDKYLDTLNNCKEILQSATSRQALYLKNLKTKPEILQAFVEFTDGRKFDFWFRKVNSSETTVHPGPQVQPYRFAEVRSIYPYLYHFDGSKPLNESFLMYLVKLYDEAVAGRPFEDEPAVSENVKNKFMSSKDEPLAPISSFYPNAGKAARSCVAEHEAAHGVIYYLFGCCNLAYIDVRPDQFTAGRVREKADRDFLSFYDDLAFEVILDYAGYVNEGIPLLDTTSDVRNATKAVRMWVERNDPAFDYGLVDFDELDVPKKIWIAHECISLCQQFYAMTKDIVQRNSDLIAALAVELNKKEFMYCEEIFDFLRSIDPDRFGLERRKVREVFYNWDGNTGCVNHAIGTFWENKGALKCPEKNEMTPV